jgi:hypothetical protein
MLKKNFNSAFLMILLSFLFSKSHISLIFIDKLKNSTDLSSEDPNKNAE